MLAIAYCLRLFSDKIALHISNEDTMFLVLGICGQALTLTKAVTFSRKFSDILYITLFVILLLNYN